MRAAIAAVAMHGLEAGSEAAVVHKTDVTAARTDQIEVVRAAVAHPDILGHRN